MAFEAGTSTGVHHTVGLGLGGGGLGLAGAQTTTTTMTELAAKVAPPSRMGLGIFHGFLFVLGIAGLAFYDDAGPKVMGAIILVLAIVWMVFKKRWNRTTYPRLVEQWERSWICHRCGQTFTQ